MSTKTEQKTFNCSLRVPAADVDKVDAILIRHQAWMRATHSLSGDAGLVQLVDYHVVKSNELKDIVDPSQGTTGSVIYFVNETYVYPDGPSQHLEQAMKWDGVGEFIEMVKTYSVSSCWGEVMLTH